MTILDKIIADKKKEVALTKRAIPVGRLMKSYLFDRTPYSLSQSLRNSSTGIIAEHKRRSPSKDVINLDVDVQEVAKGYEQAGAAGMSVLTNMKYFGGSLEDLLLARSSVQIPLLRKEFIVDPYQLYEAPAYGADAVLLIASALSKDKIVELSTIAQSIDLEVLVEVHDKTELDRALLPTVNIVGVNNRNLKTFDVDINTSIELAELIPNDFVKISESGIHTGEELSKLRKAGYEGFLIGERFMKSEDPGESAKQFIEALSK